MTELTKFADRKSFLADKSELTEEELAQLCELSEEDVDLDSLETFTEKKFKELSEKEREDLAGRLLKAEYKKYKNCWISTSKLLYETPETLTKEAKALDVLGGLGYEAFLLPYGYARNNQKLFMKSAGSLVKGRFLEMKTVVSKGATAGQSAYRDSRKQADSAFITYTEDISPHAAMESLWNYVNGAKAALDKAGKWADFSGEVFLYFEKSGKTMLFEVSSDGKFSQKSVSDFGFKKAPPLEEGRVVEDVEAKPFEPPKENLQQNSNSVKGETEWEVPGAIEKWNAERNGREGAFIPVSRLVKIIPENDAQVQAVLSDENYHVVFSDAARALLLMANYDETSFEFMLDPDSGAFVEVKRNPFEIVGTSWPDQMLGYLAYEINYRLENIEDFSSEKDKWAARVLSPFIANLSPKAIENLLKSGGRPAAAEDVEYLLGKSFCSGINERLGVNVAQLLKDEVEYLWDSDIEFVAASEEAGSKIYLQNKKKMLGLDYNGFDKPYMNCGQKDFDKLLEICVEAVEQRIGDNDEYDLKSLAAFKELLALRQGKEIKKENERVKKNIVERKAALVGLYVKWLEENSGNESDFPSMTPEEVAGKWLNDYADIYLVKYKSLLEVKEPSETEAKALEILQELFDSERIEKRISDAEGAAKKLGTWKGENPEKEIVDAFYAARDMGAAEFVQKISFEDLEALVLAKDAIQHGAEGLGFVRPNAEQMEAGWNYGYPFEVITTGYFVRKGPDGLNENVVKGMPEGAVYIEYADEMAVFSDDFEAASQWNKDNGEPGIFYSRDQLWFGDIKDTFQFPDIEENRASLKEWILEKPLEFDWKEFSKKKFEKLQKGVDSGKIPSGELGRVYLGSCAFDLSYDGNSNGMLSLQCWVLGEKGNDDNALIFGEEVPYTLGSELTFGFAKSFDGWSYSTFKDELQKKIFELVEAGNKSIDLVKECRRPNVDWSDERSVKAFYEKKKIEKVLEPWEKAVAEGSCAKVYPYDADNNNLIREVLSEALDYSNPAELPERYVRAFIDNLGDDSCVLYVGTKPSDRRIFLFDKNAETAASKEMSKTGIREVMESVYGWALDHRANGAVQADDLRSVEEMIGVLDGKERTKRFVSRLAEVSAKMEKPLAKNLDEFEGYALENGVGVSEEDYKSFLDSYKARSESEDKGVLTWLDIYFSAMGTGFGNEFLAVKDSARYEIGEYAKKAYGLDIEEEDFPEEAIESFLEEHPELDRFTPDGAFIPAIEFEKKVDALVSVDTVFNENKEFDAEASGFDPSFERQFTATLTDEGAAAIGLPPLGSKNKRYELRVTFGKDSAVAVGAINGIGEYAAGEKHHIELQLFLRGEAQAVFGAAVRASVEFFLSHEKNREAAKEYEGKMVFLKDGELEIREPTNEEALAIKISKQNKSWHEKDAFVERLAEVSAKLGVRLAENSDELSARASAMNISVSEEDFKNYNKAFEKHLKSGEKDVLTWDDIYFASSGTRPNSPRRRALDDARAQIVDYAKRRFGVDLTEYDVVDDGVDQFLFEHPELDMFSPRGNFLGNDGIDKRISSFVSFKNSWIEDDPAGLESGRQFRVKLDEKNSSALGLPELKEGFYELVVAFDDGERLEFCRVDQFDAKGNIVKDSLEKSFDSDSKWVFNRAEIGIASIVWREFFRRENGNPSKEPVKIVLKDRNEMEFAGSDREDYGRAPAKPYSFEKELFVAGEEGGVKIALMQLRDGVHAEEWSAWTLGGRDPDMPPLNVQLPSGAEMGPLSEAVKAACKKLVPEGNYRIESWSRGTDLTSHLLNEDGAARDEAEESVLSYFMEDVRESCGGNSKMVNVLLQAARKLDKYTPLEKEMLNRAFLRQGLDSSGKLKAFLQKGAAPERVPAKKRERDAWFGQSL